MNYQEFVRIVIYLCALIFGGLALWYRGNAKVSGRVAALIRRAEELYSDLTQAGGIKFEWVVGQLYDLIPLAVRPFVPRKLVEQIVQTTFDDILLQKQIHNKQREYNQRHAGRHQPIVGSLLGGEQAKQNGHRIFRLCF